MAGELTLTDEQLRQFGEDGYIGPLAAPWGAPAVEALARAAMDCLAKPNPIYDCRYENLEPGPERAGETEDRRRRRVERAARTFAHARDRHLESRPLFDALSHPAILEPVSQIIGPDVLVWRSQLFQNFRRLIPRKDDVREDASDANVNVPWHQEVGYLGTAGRPALVGGTNISLWMALRPCNATNGTLRVLPKSHRLGQLAIRPRDERPGVFEHHGFVEQVDFSQAVELEFEAGQFVLFDDYLLHGSRVNETAVPRLGLSARYASPTTRLFKRTHTAPPGLRSTLAERDLTRASFPRLVYPMVDESYDNWGLPLTHWGTVLVRGEDRYGWNRIASPPAPEPLDTRTEAATAQHADSALSDSPDSASIDSNPIHFI